MEQEITKGQIVDLALKQLALYGALINPSPSDRNDFLSFLEVYVPSLNNHGIHVGYKLSPYGIDPNASEDSGITIDNASAISLGLAVYGAASKGIMVPPNLASEAHQAKQGLYSVELIQMESNSTLPAGAGNGYIGLPYSDYQSVEDNLTVEKDGQIDDLTI